MTHARVTAEHLFGSTARRNTFTALNRLWRKGIFTPAVCIYAAYGIGFAIAEALVSAGAKIAFNCFERFKEYFFADCRNEKISAVVAALLNGEVS